MHGVSLPDFRVFSGHAGDSFVRVSTQQDCGVDVEEKVVRGVSQRGR
jgi:hypothetical protein